ncbi:unnamed protein product [Peronospora effusa]|nr:unnamed protein product [Peronospora effusa]
MPPKRGKADGSPAKAPMQSSTKRTRRDLSQPSQSASGTGVDLSSHYHVNEDPSTTMRSSHFHHPKIRPRRLRLRVQRLSLSALLRKESVATQSDVTPHADVLTIHNGKSGECELFKAPQSTYSASLARRREGGYVSGGLQPMPPPSEWMHSDGSSASLLQRATIDAHKFYSVFPLWKKQGKALGRAFPIPVVLHSNETADDYEAELRRRVTLHEDATKQRSQ